LEHGELVAQDQDLDLLGGVGSGVQHDPAQELGEHLVDQPQRHQRIMPGCMPRANEQVIPEGAGPVNPLFLVVIFLLAVLRLLVGAPK
jgi:hypothetical protein